MPVLSLNLHPAVDKAFRDMVVKHYGMRRGNLTAALEDAIANWIVNVEDEDLRTYAREDVKKLKTETV